MGNFVCDCSDSSHNNLPTNNKDNHQSLTLDRSKDVVEVVTTDGQSGQNSFRKISMIGSGAFSIVFLVEDLRRQHQQQKRFAMKQISKRKLRNARLVKEILMQRTIMKEFKSKFLLSLNSSFQDQHNCYFVTELASGGDVHSFIYNSQEPDKEILFRQTREEGPRFIVACVVLALQELHSKDIMYRDLKPDNIFVYEDGYVKLGDFGLACKISEGVKNVSFVGTAGYQAPEIIDRKGILSNYIAYGREVDFWSLGVLLYELIFKDLPFDAYQVCRLRYKEICKTFESGESWPGGKYVSEEASNLINGLMKIDPIGRLGVANWSDIKDHAFFSCIDWNKLCNKEYPSPLKGIVNCFPLKPSKFDEDANRQPKYCEYQQIKEFSFDERLSGTVK